MKRTTTSLYNWRQCMTVVLSLCLSPMSTSSFGEEKTVPATTTTTRPSTSTGSSNTMHTTMRKARILCLHGKFQSGAILSNKIAGARRKLARVYDLDFLNGPIRLVNQGGDGDENEENGSRSSRDDAAGDDPMFAWFLRNEQAEDGSFHYSGIPEALDYILQETNGISYDAILGFSQGGTVATALAASGALPSVQAVVTAGSPFIEDVFVEVAALLGNKNEVENDGAAGGGLAIPKLHLAGATDAMVSVESTRRLCERGGNGQLLLHEQGHLFPTRAALVKDILEFLERSLLAQRT